MHSDRKEITMNAPLNLSASQLHGMLTLLEDTGYVRIALDLQDMDTLALRVRIGGRHYEISDLGTKEIEVPGNYRTDGYGGHLMDGGY
jgi:hypothetical protein